MNSIFTRFRRRPEGNPLRRPLFTALATALVVLLAAGLAPLIACGPYFPNSLIESGDASVLQAPTASFSQELRRLRLEPPARLPYTAATAESDQDATLDAEIADLRRALGQAGLSQESQAELVLDFSRRRADISALRVAQQRARDEQALTRDGDPQPTSPAPLEWEPLPTAIPREFSLYLEAAAAWHSGLTDRARTLWTAVLDLPAGERPFKSTWAAYMLGRSWHQEDPALATRWYERTRAYAQAGLADSSNLGVASLGWQAQLRLRDNDVAGAMHLYLDQFAAGSTNSSATSLALCAERVSEAKPDQRLVIARDKLLRRVVTAWYLAYASWDHLLESERPTRDHPSPAQVWLDTLEEVRAGEVPLAEQLALLAYRVGDWDAARRWVDLSADSVVAHWVHAKLLLRDGSAQAAAAELAEVIARIPLVPEPTANGEPPPFLASLTSGPDDAATRYQVRGELALLKLARGDFEQALDLFVHAQFWRDAAYVAERVLTTDELKAYLDRSWPVKTKAKANANATPSTPTPTGSATATATVSDSASEPEPEAVTDLRYLLARRLNRDQRTQEALAYLPEAHRDEQRQWMADSATFRDLALDPAVRARAGAAAAWMMRTNGMELLGTELAPDFTLYGGAFDLGEIYPDRASPKHPLTRAKRVELQRARAHAPSPYARFHYRYLAAQQAWDAAKLLPDQDPATAQLLYDAGSWLKARDPFTADLFYKALVRRCGQTPLGRAANLQRWFPPLDETGAPYVTRQPPLPGPVTDDAPAAWGTEDPGPQEQEGLAPDVETLAEGAEAETLLESGYEPEPLPEAWDDQHGHEADPEELKREQLRRGEE
ncbi:MAG: hypothetical protein IT580_08745 [Verrucomicrobiales bacterium]|nr:hypothetical protein [Verrucomicrobiales bacterium]